MTCADAFLFFIFIRARVKEHWQTSANKKIKKRHRHPPPKNKRAEALILLRSLSWRVLSYNSPPESCELEFPELLEFPSTRVLSRLALGRVSRPGHFVANVALR